MTFLDPPAPSGFWDSQNITGNFFIVTDKHTTEDLTNGIVLYLLSPGETQEQAVGFFMNRGLVALLTLLREQSEYPGFGNWVRDGSHPTGHTFPVFEVSQLHLPQFQLYVENVSSVPALITFDPNPWDPAFQIALPIIGFFILISSGITSIMSAYKLTLLVLQKGVHLTIAHVVLTSATLGSITRIIWTAADPFAAYGTTNWTFSNIFMTIGYPFVISDCLLISLYWHEMIKRTGNKMNMFLDKMFWPFLAYFAFMICFEFTTSILRGLNYSFSLLVVVDGLTYVVVTLFVLVFFIITRWRLQKLFDSLNSRLKSRREERLQLATVQLQVIVVFLLLCIILLICVGVSSALANPAGYPIVFGLFYGCLQVVCFFQVLLIAVPSPPIHYRLCGCIFGRGSQESHRLNSASSPPVSGVSV